MHSHRAGEAVVRFEVSVETRVDKALTGTHGVALVLLHGLRDACFLRECEAGCGRFGLFTKKGGVNARLDERASPEGKGFGFERHTSTFDAPPAGAGCVDHIKIPLIDYFI